MDILYFNKWENLKEVFIWHYIITFIFHFVIVAIVLFILVFIINLLHLYYKQHSYNNKLKKIREKIRKEYFKKALDKKWKDFIKHILNYIETLWIEWEYKDIEEVSELLWLTNEDKNDLIDVIYKDRWDWYELSKKIKNKIEKISH